MNERRVAAVDVGGTAIKAAWVDECGRFVDATERATPVADGPEAVVAAIREVVGSLMAEDVAGVGVVVPGSVDAERGVAVYSANLGWRGVPLREVLAANTDRPVVLGHDVGAAALAERTVGPARDVAHSLTVVIGTGIASVSVAAGRVITGASGRSGELGHIPIRPGGETCRCGQRGCLEVYASARAIAERYARRTGTARSTPEVIARAADDPDAGAIWAEAIAALADALVVTTMLEDPGLIVIAGGLAEAGETLVAPVRAAVAERLAWRTAPPIVASPLGVRAGRYGAAVLAWTAAGRTDFGGWRISPGPGVRPGA